MCLLYDAPNYFNRLNNNSNFLTVACQYPSVALLIKTFLSHLGKKQRITLIECNNDINSMIDIAKIADLVRNYIEFNFIKAQLRHDCDLYPSSLWVTIFLKHSKF